MPQDTEQRRLGVVLLAYSAPVIVASVFVDDWLLRSGFSRSLTALLSILFAMVGYDLIVRAIRFRGNVRYRALLTQGLWRSTGRQTALGIIFCVLGFFLAAEYGVVVGALTGILLGLLWGWLEQKRLKSQDEVRSGVP
jgi:ABC-type phosphate transport system permease subunit